MAYGRRRATRHRDPADGAPVHHHRHFSVLAVSFWVLQVVQHAKYEELAENNHQRTLALRAPRGSFSIATARCSSRTAAPTAFRSSASTPRI